MIVTLLLQGQSHEGGFLQARDAECPVLQTEIIGFALCLHQLLGDDEDREASLVSVVFSRYMTPVSSSTMDSRLRPGHANELRICFLFIS
ncbi:hypothetical protein VFPPC_18696 [Pochonia chlamydosporia 170]|uniref:Uncharacterized protein n=1 Tax=Pochonia chlamydosporia 170 TaxID=1380566 RepID=A0A219AS76_METCM|nr:hypothetical protein VFPPC_18696 [Pochonia chlamydosporia 170]OWT43577.1 hypothetical protein VFPPC_18696 [Pochonia chlamydosporia 170]